MDFLGDALTWRSIIPDPIDVLSRLRCQNLEYPNFGARKTGRIRVLNKED